jgi:hypothetical protein
MAFRIKPTITGAATNVFGNRQNVTFNTPLDGQKGKFSPIGHQYDNGTWLSAAEAVKLSIAATAPFSS